MSRGTRAGSNRRSLQPYSDGRDAKPVFGERDATAAWSVAGDLGCRIDPPAYTQHGNVVVS